MDAQKSMTKLITNIVSVPGIHKCCFNIMSKFFDSVIRVHREHVGSMKQMLLLLCLISAALDSLFFYIPAIGHGGHCLVVDTKFGVAVVVLRSIVDCFYMIHVIYRLRAHLFMPCLRAYARRSLSKEAWYVAKGYLFWFLLIDLPAILPLPQTVVSVTIPRLKSNRFLEAMTLLKYFVLLQYVPRSLRMHGMFGAISNSSGILAKAASSKAAFNFFLYLLASHIAGALWYFFAIERATTCWKKACASYNCTNASFYCGYSFGNMTFIDDYCPIQTPDTRRFDFGLFLEALQSGITEEETGFPQKLLHCFLWGLQSLSCFGQNLRTSTNFWENLFAVFIVIVGLVLFVSLIGNMQLYLQSQTIRTEEMRLKGREIEHWMPFRKLPDDLKKQVKKYQQYKWEETRGVDVENFLNHLPKDLSIKIKSELCSELLMKVEKIKEMGKKMVDMLCDFVKPTLYIAGNHIIEEGDAIDQMLFIVRGKLWAYGSSYPGIKGDGNDRDQMSMKEYLGVGDFCGEELLPWAMEDAPPPTLPISERTIQAVAKVEAFVLLATDLKKVLQFMRKRKSMAAGRIQSAWRQSRGNNKAEKLPPLNTIVSIQ